MGQQQILILVLVTIIVGIAVIIAIDSMEESRDNANRDALQQEMLRIISESQAYYYRGSVMQGGGGSFNGIEFSDISIEDSTANGTYTISGNGNTLVVEGAGASEQVSLRADAKLSNGDMQVQWTEE